MTKTSRLDGLSYQIEIGAHKIISDVKSTLGGKDAGADPHELLEAALAACTSITVQMYANRKAWNLVSCNTEVKFIEEDAKDIILERTLHLEGTLDEEQKARLLQIAEKCPIHAVLSRGAKIQSKLG
jgi:putative redox protein